jgi:hypothetical protein
VVAALSDLPHQKKEVWYCEGAEEGWYCATAMSNSSAMKFDIEKFDDRINFGLWKLQVKDVRIQSRLHKYGMSGHLKRNCPGGAVSEKDSEASASNVSFVAGDDNDLI